MKCEECGKIMGYSVTDNGVVLCRECFDELKRRKI